MKVATFDPKAHQSTATNTIHNNSHELPVQNVADISDKKTKKVYIVTQGCQMNEYDSEKMGDVLGQSHGMVVTNDINEADVLLMNTCSIREKAQEKVFSELGRWRKLKEKDKSCIQICRPFRMFKPA